MKNFNIYLLSLLLVITVGCMPNETPKTTTRHIINFRTDGGSEIAALEIEDGSRVSRPSNPTRSGYTFVDWYKNEEQTELFNFDTETISTATTIYAKWEVNKIYFTQIETFTADEINLYLTLNGLSSAAKANYDITLYKHEYTTTSPYDNNEITVSGLVVIPGGVTASDIISYQHGTIFKDKYSPSNVSKNNLTLSGVGVAYLSSLSGHIVIAPDYIGYGSSLGTFHPYIHLTSTAESVIDMILSVQQHIPTQFPTISVSNSTSLLGYSQGGYASIATCYYLESNSASYADKITIKRCIPMSGLYSLNTFAQEVIQTNTVTALHNKLTAFVLLSFNKVYNLYTDITSLFVASVASQIPAVYNNLEVLEDDINPGNTINGFFSTTTTDDFQNTSRPLYKKGTENSIPTSWVPSSTINILHSREDQLLPITQVRWFAQHGGKSPSVSYDTTNVGTHSNAYIPLLLKASNLIAQTHN